jgi:hypothetical protein
MKLALPALCHGNIKMSYLTARSKCPTVSPTGVPCLALDIETVSNIVKEYANDVRCVLPVSKVILYGSYAKGTATEHSDVDVCFFLNNLDEENWLEIMVQLLGMSHKYNALWIEPMAFHVSDLEDDNPFVKEVLRTGIEIQ